MLIFGADHAGYKLKEYLKNYCHKKHEIIDCGTYNGEIPVDYPDYIGQVVKFVVQSQSEISHKNLKAVLICASGIGMSIAANRYNGIRAALCRLPEEASLARRHNDANIIVFGANFIDYDVACECLDVFMNSNFEGGRHARRISKIL